MNRLSESMDSTSTLTQEPNIGTEPFLSECQQVMDFVGEGAFGHVIKYFCIKTCEMEAIKILKKFPGLPPQEKNEVVILEQLQSLDPDTSGIIKWNGSSTYQDHIWISYELLDQDLHM